MDIELQKRPIDGDKARILDKILRVFGYSLVIASLGAFAGQFVPPALFIPLIILELILVIWLVFSDRTKGYWILFLFAFISGMTFYPLLTHYLSVMGGEMVAGIFAGTAIIFTLLGIFGYRLNKNLSGWGMVLFVMLLGLIVISLLQFFIPFNNTMEIIVASLGILIFSLFTVYDFNQIKYQPIGEEDVPMIVLNLYLDFINLFIDLLRLIASLFFDD